jgi:hypothetical protein
MHAAHRHRRGTARPGPALVLAALVALSTVGLATVPAGASSSAAVAQAKQGLLKLTDFPVGWTAAASTADNSIIPGAAQLAKCLGVPLSVVIGVPPTANSKQFTSSDEINSVADNVTVFKSAAAARADFNSIASAKAPNCLNTDFNGPAKAQLRSEFGTGATVGSVVVARNPKSAFGPGTTNVTIFFPVTQKGTTLNVELIIADYVKGNVEQTVQFIGIQPPVSPTLTKHLTTVADKRI